SDVVLTSIDRKVQETIGFDGVGALRLQRVGSDLIDQTNAAPFLAQVNQNAKPPTADLGLSAFERFSAVAFERSEYLAGQALRMNSDRHAALAANIAHDQREVLVR